MYVHLVLDIYVHDRKKNINMIHVNRVAFKVEILLFLKYTELCTVSCDQFWIVFYLIIVKIREYKIFLFKWKIKMYFCVKELMEFLQENIYKM